MCIRDRLKEPELLLLDEPTNHVDVHGVAWLTKYINDLSDKKISSMIVSHDTVFLDNVAQDCVHYEKNRKLKVYKGNLSEFVKLVPEAAAYYKLESDNVAFSFPDPGMLEGVTSKTKALMKMVDCSFKYPTRDINTLNNISVQVSMAGTGSCMCLFFLSRVARGRESCDHRWGPHPCNNSPAQGQHGRMIGSAVHGRLGAVI